MISESWLTPAIPDAAINLPGFNLLRQDQNQNLGKKGGGLCIYVKEIFSIDSLDERYNTSLSDYEIMGIKIKHPNIRPFNIIRIYRPPNGKHCTFCKLLENDMPDLINDRSETFILGDFNINYNSESLRRKFSLNKLENKNSLKQLIKDHTRCTTTSNTLIDLIFTDSPNISSSGTLHINLSDHSPVYLIRKKERNRIVKHVTKGRSYIRYSTAVFENLLQQQNWNEFDISDDIDRMWDIMKENISLSLDIICPIRNIQVSDTKPDWLNNDIIQLMRKRDKAYLKARRSKNEVGWRKATFLRNRVESFIKNHKKNKIITNLERYHNNATKFWRQIREIVPKEKSPIVNSLLDERNGQSFEGIDLCNHINQYFASIGKTLAEQIKQRHNYQKMPPKFNLVMNMNADGISSRPFGIEELRKAITLIDPKKSAAVENIRSNVILDAFNCNFDRVLKMYNMSLSHSVFPDAWKTSIVVPLPRLTILSSHLIYVLSH